MCVILLRMNATLHIRITDELDTAIRNAACAAGISVSKWVRWSMHDQIANPGLEDAQCRDTRVSEWIRHHAGRDALDAAMGSDADQGLA